MSGINHFVEICFVHLLYSFSWMFHKLYLYCMKEPIWKIWKSLKEESGWKSNPMLNRLRLILFWNIASFGKNVLASFKDVFFLWLLSTFLIHKILNALYTVYAHDMSIFILFISCLIKNMSEMTVLKHTYRKIMAFNVTLVFKAKINLQNFNVYAHS